MPLREEKGGGFGVVIRSRFKIGEAIRSGVDLELALLIKAAD
jgi:hypothetical protein